MSPNVQRTPEAMLGALVATPSLSGQESEAAELVAAVLESWGHAPQRLENNVWVEAGASGPRLLLHSHLDTVAVCQGWDSDPWLGEWRDDRLIGLGANDAKGCVTAMLFAFHRLSREAGGRVVLALTAEEETGGPNGIQAVLPHLGELDGAFIGEPTGLRVCIAQRGLLLLRCVAEGVSGHVAHGIGVNAIEKAARDVLRLAELRFEPHPMLGETRAQVTVIAGGLARNQIPDRCEFFIDLRTTPNLDHEAVTAQLTELLESETLVHSERYAPMSIDAAHPLVAAALSASSSAEPVGSATVSDWAFMGDVPSVKVGPGDTLRSHTPNEFLLQSELEAGIHYYVEAVRQAWRRLDG